jgi:hypothetical protein
MVVLEQRAWEPVLVWVALELACWRPAVFRYRSKCLLASLAIHRLEAVQVQMVVAAAAVAESG